MSHAHCRCLYLFPCVYSLKVQARCPGTHRLSEMSVSDFELVGFVSVLFVDVREESVVALHLPSGSKKNPALGCSRYRDVNPVPTIHWYYQYCRKNIFAPVKMKTSFFKIIHHNMALSKP